jgi:hypothetical protein
MLRLERKLRDILLEVDAFRERIIILKNYIKI